MKEAEDVTGFVRASANCLRAILWWWVPLTLFTLWAQLNLGLSLPLAGVWGLVEGLAGDAALIFPFCAFAGGLAQWRDRPRSSPSPLPVILATGLLAGSAYMLGAILMPVAEVEVDGATTVDMAHYYPWGAHTPQNILRQRRAIIELGDIDYSFSIERPMRHPPNWLLFGLHQSIVFAVFGVVNAIVGFLVGGLTLDLPPPVRRRRRWLAGLVSGAVFFALAFVCNRWVTMSPDAPAVPLAWLPLAAPMALGFLLAAALDRRASSGSDRP